MAKNKRELTEIEQLDEFLQLEGYHEIYDQLTERSSKYFELFKPLEFFKAFSKTFEYVEKNTARPLSVSRYLEADLTLPRKKPLTDKQRYFFYDRLLWWFENVRVNNAQLEVCCREIEKLRNKLKALHGNEEQTHQQGEFEAVLSHLQTLPTDEEKIAFLIQEKTKSEQADGSFWVGLGEKTFAEKCELEINKLKQIRLLKHKPERSADSIKKHQDLTLDRATLALNYLLNYANTNCHNTEKAKFISFLTGYSEKQIAQRLSRLHKKEDENYVAYQRDMKIIGQYFAKLGLNKITSQIENDLNT